MNLKRLRVQVMMRAPFFGSMLHNIKLVESRDIPTACIDKNLVARFNPDFMDTLSEEEQIFVVCHELIHAVLLHVYRIFEWSNKDAQRMGNVAADYLDNYLLVEMGLKMPKIVTLYNKQYNPDSYTLESLVKHLMEEQQKQPQKGNSEGNDQGIADGTDIEPGDGDEDQSADQQAKQREVERNLKSSLASAIMQAKKRGDLPGCMKRFADEILEPKIKWKEVLADWFNVKIKEARTWQRPNRKQAYRGVYSPTTNSLGCGHIGIAVDVSGSIGQKELNVWASELNYIFEQCRPSKVTICYFDTQKYVREFDELPIQLEAIGGGGTAFEVPINFFNNEVDEDITGLVFMTDMYGNWPSEPDYPVLILSTTPNQEAPWGRTVYCEME
jgi:predicted metal-dependent peptidase